MLKSLQAHANSYLDGLTTQREFLAQLVNVIGEKWQNCPEETENEDDIDRLARILYGIDP